MKFIILVLGLCGHLFSQIPDDVTVTTMFGTEGANAFDNPVWFGQIPGVDDTYLVLEQETGNVMLIDNTGASATTSEFYQVDVRSDSHEGLLGLAFHPDFATNRQYYLSYTPQSGSNSIVEQRTASEDYLSDSGEEGVEILSLSQPAARHNLGNIAFGPDGFLYIGSGNGGEDDDTNTNGQDISNLYCAILRIDVDNPAGGNAYGIPADNPFASGGGAPEIFANGLRNPWRFSFDPLTGDLWAGDVGSNIAEEISIVGLGDNMGWKTLEGTTCFSLGCNLPASVPPIWEYVRSGIPNNQLEARTIVGGYVFRASQTSEYYGVYIFSDNRTGGLWGITQSGGTLTEEVKWPSLSGGVASFGRDEPGNIYTVHRTSGAISKLELGEPDVVFVEPANSRLIQKIEVLSFSTNAMMLNLERQGKKVLTLKNIQGKTLFQKTVLRTGKITVNPGALKSGLYLLHVNNEGNTASKLISFFK